MGGGIELQMALYGVRADKGHEGRAAFGKETVDVELVE